MKLRLQDLICHSERHELNRAQQIAEVIVRVKPAIEGKRAAQYVFAEPYGAREYENVFLSFQGGWMDGAVTQGVALGVPLQGKKVV